MVRTFSSLLDFLINRLRSTNLAQMRKEADQFISLVKSLYSIDLQYSKDSVISLEQVADKAKNATDALRQSLESGMAFYLGEVLLARFGGEWKESELGPSVILERTGIGSNLEIAPAIWVAKRLHYGKQDALWFKVAVLESNFDRDWRTDWLEDQENSAVFAAELHVPQMQQFLVDEWIAKWLEIHKHFGRLSIKQKATLDQSSETAAWYKEHNERLIERLPLLDQGTWKYAWGRAIKMYDCLNFTVFGNVSSGYRIKNVMEHLSAVVTKFMPEELTALLDYLQDSPVGPNGDLFENVWKTEAKSHFFKLGDPHTRSLGIISLLRLNGRRGFHHNIKDFKRILKLVRPDNIDVFEYLPTYHVEHLQGCYKVIEHVLRMAFLSHSDKPVQFEKQRQFIFWLDSARGRQPGAGWQKMLAKIRVSLQPSEVERLCTWILAHEELAVDSERWGWRDDVFRRFLKSSRWYLMQR